MNESTKEQNKHSFYPIPQGASLIISTDERYVTPEELMSVAMHLSLDKPGRKIQQLDWSWRGNPADPLVQYWIRVESDE